MSGRPNTITADGLGGTFGEEIIGVTLEAGTTGQGEYSVVYDEDQNGIVDPYDAVFENAFSVDLLTPPPSLPAGLSELKVTWERQAHGWQTTRAGFQGVFQALETKGLSGALQDAFVFHPDDLGLWQTLTSSVRSVVLLNHPSDLVFLQTLDAAGHLDGRAADPPDPDFRQPSPPAADAPIEPLDSDPLRNAVLRVADNLRFESALEGALLHDVERYQGAAAARNSEWALIHARALRDNATQLADQLGRTTAALTALRASLLSDPRDIDGAAAAFGAFAGRVAATGFTADELREFANLGLSQSAVDGLRAAIAGRSPFVFSRATLAAQLGDLIAADATAAAGLATVTTQMRDVVTVLESNPGVPQRTPLARPGAGYTAAEGAPVRLDGSASGDPGGTIVSWQWDLNLDGAFDDAAGPTPVVTFPRSFDGWVGLRVTDDHGRTGIGYARMTVTDANRPPVIATRTPDAPLLGVDVGGSLPFAVTAGDPDSDPVTDSWFVDNQPAGSGPTFTYAPTQVGVHVVRAEASDNQPSGGRAVAEWTVGVRLPGADNPPPPPPRLDLAVAQVDTSGLTTNPQTLEATGAVAVTLANRGADALLNGRDGPVAVRLFEDRNADGAFEPGVDNFLGTASFSGDIPAGGSVTLSAAVHTISLFRDNPIYAVVDPDDTIPETNEANNAGNSGLPSHYQPTGGGLPMVKWQWDSTLPIIEAAPTVAPLIDTNGDGRIDARDVPAVVLNDAAGAGVPGRLVALRGDTGQVIFSVPAPADVNVQAVPTVGDLDGDGRPEILLESLRGRLYAFNNDGTIKWTSARTPSGHQSPFPVLVDVDGDGKSEILMGTSAFNSDGTLRWDAAATGQSSAGYLGGGESWGAMQPADLNLDGIPEIIAGPSALDRAGHMLWSWRTVGSLLAHDYVAQLSLNDGPWVDQFHTTVPLTDGWTAVANLDGDPFPEIIVVSPANSAVAPFAAAGLWIFRHDGSLFAPPVGLLQNGSDNRPFFVVGPPTVADFDGDGRPEIAVTVQKNPGGTTVSFDDPARDILYVFKTDGTEVWHKDLTPGSINSTYPPAAFDFDGDGAAELVVQDMQYLSVLDGRTGATRFQFAINNNRDLVPTKYPLIADLDNDGSAEIVAFASPFLTAGSPQRQGLVVLGDANANWVQARRSWNQWMYQPAFTNEDGAVPAHARNSWQVQNGLRAQTPIDGVDPFAAPDLTASRVTVDTAGCGAPAGVTARVGNGGSLQAGAGVPVNFFLGDPAAGGTLLGTRTTSRPLFPGQFEDVTFNWSTPVSGPIFVTVNEPLPAARVASADLALLPNTWAEAGGFQATSGAPVNQRAFNGIDGSSATVWAPLDPNIDPRPPFYEVHFPFPVEVTGVTIRNVLSTFAFLGTGTLTFSNGFSVPFALSAAGAGSVTFPEQDGITWVRLTSSATAPNGPALAEFVAAGSYVPPEFKQKEGVGRLGNNLAAAGFTGLPCDPAADFTPTVFAGPDRRLDEGDTLALPPALFTDPGRLGTHTATIDWGDGSPVEPGAPTESGGSGAVAGAHAFSRAGTFTVTVRVTDPAGHVGVGTFTASVRNLPAAVAAGSDRTATEGDAVNLAAGFTDPGHFDSHTATIDWGDGTVEAAAPAEAGGAGTVTGAHTYRDNGDYRVTVSVREADGTTGVATFTVHVYEDDGTFLVTVMVTDDDGGVGTATVRVTVTGGPG